MKTWDKAEAFCIQKGGHLASVASEATEAYVLRAKGNKTLKNLWLGGSDKEEEGVWKWSDGSPWNFTNWNKYQPTPLDVSSDEDCLQYYYSNYATKWSDRPCSVEGNFVCSQMLCSGEQLVSQSENMYFF